MHLTLAQGRALATAILKEIPDQAEETIVLLPPFTALQEMRKMVADSPVGIGAQDVFWEDSGAFTGEISPPMLTDLGCGYVVIGHSERRQHFGETEETVNRKIRSALNYGLSPIFCIGESLEEREAGKTFARLEAQIRDGLRDIGPQAISQVIIAYEPVWAIGTGKNATPQQAEEVHEFIRQRVAEKYGDVAATCAIIIYGGSVKPANSYSLFREQNIDGFLVGGASLEAGSFVQIFKEALRAYKDLKEEK